MVKCKQSFNNQGGGVKITKRGTVGYLGQFRDKKILIREGEL
jgi:hypothetical protein